MTSLILSWLVACSYIAPEFVCQREVNKFIYITMYDMKDDLYISPFRSYQDALCVLYPGECDIEAEGNR